MDALKSDGTTNIRGWTLERGRLVRTEVFSNFQAAMRWVNRVALLAEQRNHHPDIDIRWNRVTLTLMTHEADGLTDRDWSWIRDIPWSDAYRDVVMEKFDSGYKKGEWFRYKNPSTVKQLGLF
jgi:4a-hydroxytetrahydrobiopterin dehydratase